jgi:hypothetical protein
MTDADRTLLDTLIQRQHRSLLAAFTQSDPTAFHLALSQFAIGLSPLTEELQLQAAGRWAEKPVPPITKKLAGPRRPHVPLTTLVHTEQFTLEGRRAAEVLRKPPISGEWNPGGRKK